MGQFYRESASLAHGAANDHPAAMGFDNMFHDAQSDANTLGLPPQFRTNAVKALEDFLMFLRRNAWPVVFDGKSDE